MFQDESISVITRHGHLNQAFCLLLPSAEASVSTESKVLKGSIGISQEHAGTRKIADEESRPERTSGTRVILVFQG